VISEYKEIDSTPADLPRVTPSSIGWYPEPIGVWSTEPVIAMGPQEQLNITQYRSIYLWYVTNVTVTQAIIDSGKVTVSLSHAEDHELFYLNGIILGRGDGANSLTDFTFSSKSLTAGPNQPLQILSMTQGLNNGADSNLAVGITGSVVFNGTNVSKNTFYHQPGTYGERIRIFGEGGQSVTWNQSTSVNTPMTWYQMIIPTPTISGDPAKATWMFDMSGMGKGELWCNGFMLGAYWSIRSGSGYSQQYYHMPRDYLSAQGQNNTVVVLEEQGGNPQTVALIQRNSFTD